MSDKKPTMKEALERLKSVAPELHNANDHLQAFSKCGFPDCKEIKRAIAALDEGEAPKMDHKCEEGVCLICHPIEPNKPPAAAEHCRGCDGLRHIMSVDGVNVKMKCPGIPAAQPAVSEEDIKLIEDAADAVPPALREGESILLERLDALAARLRREEKL